MEALLQDIRYGLRILFTNKPFTVTVVVIIGLGIGANTAIFSIVDAALLQRLPFDDAEQLVVVNGVADRPSGPQVRGASYPDLVAPTLRRGSDRLRSFCVSRWFLFF